MTLTVAIPTFNRNKYLLQTVSALLPQLTPECRLVIYDNHSDVPVAETLAEEIAQFPQANVDIRRNSVNIGGLANFMRCLEACETPWAWVLGDDDPPLPDAVATIFAAIHEYPDTAFFAFAFGQQPWKTTTTGRGLDEFLSRVTIPSVGFISANVYNMAAIRPHIADGYTYGSGWYPFLVFVLMALKNGHSYCLSDRQIVPFAMPPAEIGWSYLQYAVAIGINADLPLQTPTRRRLQDLIALELLPEALIVILLAQIAAGTVDRAAAVARFDQIYVRALAPSRLWKRKLIGWAGTYLLRVPRLSWWLARVAHRIIYRIPLSENVQLKYWLKREGVWVKPT